MLFLCGKYVPGSDVANDEPVVEQMGGQHDAVMFPHSTHANCGYTALAGVNDPYPP